VTVRVIWLLIGTPAVAAAQSVGQGPELPDWLVRWSPLRSAGDLGRRLPSGRSVGVPLLFGAPRIGTFWTAGNPGAIAQQIRDSRADYLALAGGERGGYRRPLDPESARLLRGRAQAWRAITPRFSLIGAVRLDQTRTDSSRADFAEPYGSSPFTLTDTLGTPMRRIGAVLEGGAGWQLGAWGVGAALGYQQDENLSTLSPVVRRIRSVTSGASAGLTRQVGSLVLGLSATGRYSSESAALVGRFGSTLAQDLAGYRSIPGIPVTPTGGDARRHRQDVFSGGASVSGRLGTASRWVLAAARVRSHERFTRQESNDPAWDRWNQSGWNADAALQSPMGAGQLLTLRAGYVTARGEGALAADTTGFVFTARESGFDSEAELRLLPSPGAWEGRLAMGLAREARTRSDSITRVQTVVTSITPSLSVELGRTVGARAFVGIGGLYSHYGPTSTLPRPGSLNATFRTYVVPEYAVYSTPANLWAVSVLGRWQVSGRAALWVSSGVGRLSPTVRPSPPYPRPDGSRSAVSLVAGVTVRDGQGRSLP
jgi:hypothetical protein